MNESGRPDAPEPVVAMLEARVDRLERTVRYRDSALNPAEYAVAVAQLREARRALADYEE